VVVVGGLVGGVVVGGAVVGAALVEGVVVDGGDGAGTDLVTGGAVVGDEDVPFAGVLVAVGDVVLVLVPELALVAAPPVEAALDAALTADDFPSERTANQAFSTPCPVASPFLASLTKRYSAWSWKNTCKRPPWTLMAVSPLTPCGAFIRVTPFGSSRGGHALAHAPVHVAWPAGSTL
jgi:hypothetical protein